MAGCYRHLGRVEDGFRRLEVFFEGWRAEIAALEIPERRPDDLRPHFTREEHLAYLEGEWKRGRTAFGR